MSDFLIYSSYLILLINLILYSISFFRKGKANVFFVEFLFFISILQLVMEILYHQKIDNLILVNLYFLGQFILLGLFFRSLFTIKNQKNFILWTLISGVIIIVVHYIYDYKVLFKFNLFAIVLTSLLLISYALIHLYNQLTTEKKYYYITIGSLIYLLPSTVLFLIGNLSSGLSNDFKYISWQLNAFLIIVQQLFYLFEWKVSLFNKKK